MSVVTSSIQRTTPLCRLGELSSEREEIVRSGAVIGTDAAMVFRNTSLLDTRSIEKAPSSYKSGIKAGVLGTLALLGTTAVTYWAHRYLIGSDPILPDSLSKIEDTGLDIFPNHRIVSKRDVPIALPLENQVVPLGSSFQVNHEFFKEAGDGFIQQKIIQGPKWLTSQLDPVVSNYDTPKTPPWGIEAPQGVQIIGATAYVAFVYMPSGAELQILDITTPSNPTFIGTYKTYSIAGFQVVGTNAYVLTGGSLDIINITTPSHPIPIGTYNIPGPGSAVHVVGTAAYVTYGGFGRNCGLQIINITRPSHLTVIGTYVTHDIALNVQVVGHNAYLTDLNCSIKILNITTPSKPILMGMYKTRLAPSSFQVVGDILYLVYGNTVYISGSWVLVSELLVIHVANSSNPTLIKTYNALRWASGIQVVGNIAYVADTYSVQLINIANSSNPIFIDAYTVPNLVYKVQVVGTTLCLVSSLGIKILSQFNRIKLSGNPGTIGRANYVVTLMGTTAAGAAFTSFKLNIGNLLAPVYQYPIATQQATVDKHFSYVMPDSVFIDPNGYEMTYKAQDLPKWLTFDAAKGAFSGTPTSADTGTFADKSTAVTVIASDGTFETAGQFMVNVTGDSYLVKIISIGLPTLSGLGTAYSGYKNRALFLDQIAKRKWRNNQMRVKLGENFVYVLKTNAKDVRKVQAYVRDSGVLGKISEKILCGKQRHVELALSLPMWMRYNLQSNTLHSIRQLEEIDFMGQRNIQIRVLGNGNVIKELLQVELDGDVSTLDGNLDSITRQERIGLLLLPSTTANFIEMEGLKQLA